MCGGRLRGLFFGIFCLFRFSARRKTHEENALITKRQYGDFVSRAGAVALALAVAIFFRAGHTGAFAQDLPSSELPGEPIPTFSEAGEQTISAQDAGVRAAGGATWGDGSDASTAEDGKTDLRAPSSDGSDASSDSFVGPKTTRYSYELSGLPSQDGQYWIVYDIMPYTERFPNLSEPQSSIVDWIFFDSGKEFWHKEPFCILSASRERLYIYHNTKVQRYVSNVVDRFIDPSKRGSTSKIKIVAVQSPEWRLRNVKYLTSAPVSVVGNGADVQGWSLASEDLGKVLSDLERRTDYSLLNASSDTVPNGEKFGWFAAAPRKAFARDYQPDSEAAAGYRGDISSVDEGYRIEATPLLSTSGDTLETLIHYQSTAVDRSKTFSMRVPTATAPRQQLEVQRPEIVSCDIFVKTSTPRGKSTIIDLGMVPLAGIKKTESNGGLVDSVSELVSSKSAFYDVLVLIEATE